MVKFDISNQGLTTLKDTEFPENVTELNCSGNKLGSLEHCPPTVTTLDCSWNRLTSLEHCPPAITILYCSSNKLASLEHCPPTITELHCYNNYLTSLKHCPPTVTELHCYYNQITSLEHCPPAVIELDCPHVVTELGCYNILNAEYANLTIKEIHQLNKKKTFLQGLAIVQRIIQNFAAKKIQKKWQKWWYDDLDHEGINRLCKRSISDLYKGSRHEEFLWKSKISENPQKHKIENSNLGIHQCKMTEWPTNPPKQVLCGAKKFLALHDNSTFDERCKLMDPKYAKELDLFAKELEKDCMRQATISDYKGVSKTLSEYLSNVIGCSFGEKNQVSCDLSAHPLLVGCKVTVERIPNEDDACTIVEVSW